MSDWTAGYVADIGYTYGYYGELNPLGATLPLTMLGLDTPRWRTACELGFGQGVSTNLHAAASDVEWWGTDFNPDHAAFAQRMSANGSAARLFDQSFAEFAARDDLPGFDFIGLHGIWSWVSDENRAVIVDFIRRKLNVGGVVYVSYNTLPGWASGMPLRELLVEYAHSQIGAGVPTTERVQSAVGFVERLIETQPLVLHALPQLKERLAKLKSMDPAYVAHEYFNRDWQPMTFTQVAGYLGAAKLSYAGSATYLDNVRGIAATAAQHELIDGVKDPVFRETVRDYVTNQQFRRDYWVRGARRLPATELHERLFRTRVMLVRDPADVSMKLSIPGRTAKVELQQEVYGPLLEALGNHKPIDLGSLAKSLQPRGLSFAQVLQSTMILLSRSDACTVEDDEQIARVKPRVDTMNRWVLEQARSSRQVGHLACAVSGGAVATARLHMWCLSAWLGGVRDADGLANACERSLVATNERLRSKDGAELPPDEARTQLQAQGQAFLATVLPVLQRLGAVPG